MIQARPEQDLRFCKCCNSFATLLRILYYTRNCNDVILVIRPRVPPTTSCCIDGVAPCTRLSPSKASLVTALSQVDRLDYANAASQQHQPTQLVSCTTTGTCLCPHHLAPRHFRCGSLQQRTQHHQQNGHCHKRLRCRSAQAAAPTQLEAVAEDKWIQRTLSVHNGGHRSQNAM